MAKVLFGSARRDTLLLAARDGWAITSPRPIAAAGVGRSAVSLNRASGGGVIASAVTYDQAAALLNAWLLKDKQIQRQSPATADGRNRVLGNEIEG
jgi:hypothetical protein